jgi:PBP1b-binding outer membrane lipoprotein LpoB
MRTYALALVIAVLVAGCNQTSDQLAQQVAAKQAQLAQDVAACRAANPGMSDKECATQMIAQRDAEAQRQREVTAFLFGGCVTSAHRTDSGETVYGAVKCY